MQCLINQPLSIPFVSYSQVTGLTSFNMEMLIDGIPAGFISNITYTELGGGLYTINFIPVSSGNYYIFIENQLLPEFEVVNRTFAMQLQDIADESLGSWTWDKTTGILTLIRQDGTTMLTYNVVDTVSSASRELVS